MKKLFPLIFLYVFLTSTFLHAHPDDLLSAHKRYALQQFAAGFFTYTPADMEVLKLGIVKKVFGFQWIGNRYDRITDEHDPRIVPLAQLDELNHLITLMRAACSISRQQNPEMLVICADIEKTVPTIEEIIESTEGQPAEFSARLCAIAEIIYNLCSGLR